MEACTDVVWVSAMDIPSVRGLRSGLDILRQLDVLPAQPRRLLQLAEQYDFVIFEDDPYVALRFSGETLPMRPIEFVARVGPALTAVLRLAFIDRRLAKPPWSVRLEGSIAIYVPSVTPRTTKP